MQGEAGHLWPELHAVCFMHLSEVLEDPSGVPDEPRADGASSQALQAICDRLHLHGASGHHLRSLADLVHAL